MSNNIKFTPVCVTSNHLNSVPIINGQYIVVTDTHELYLDINNSRKKVSQGVYTQRPNAPVAGDIYIEIEE